MSTRRRPRIALTPGEPAGIGPDLAVALAGRPRDFDLVAVADPELLTGRAACLDTPLTAVPWAPGDVVPDTAGRLAVLPVPLAAPAAPGRLDRTNAEYVLASLQRAGQGCLSGQFDALVTGPVHKGVINDAGVAFSGHTEFLAALTGSSQPVMMLTADTLRVALVTTHLPLRAVADSITAERLEWVCRILHADLRDRFHLPRPRILVSGLNPHAGEGGHLGHEEIEVITPVLQRLRSEGLDLRGPLPADTLFTPRQLATADAALAMYHDQGLPVLKHAGFGHAVNVTLGLPIIRTSVDHGTALELAGTGRADSGSLEAALAQALTLVTRAPA